MPTDPIDTQPDPRHSSHHESPTTLSQNHRDQQRAFQCAAEEIASGASQSAGDPAPFGIEVGNLESWAHTKGTLIFDYALDLLTHAIAKLVKIAHSILNSYNSKPTPI